VHLIAQRADQGIINGIPKGAHQGGNGSQPWIDANHIGQEDGIEDLSKGIKRSSSPITTAVNQFRQQIEWLCLALFGCALQVHVPSTLSELFVVGSMSFIPDHAHCFHV